MAKMKNANLCYICGCVLLSADSSVLEDDTFTWDHLVPRSMGGSSDANNKKPCCHRCNTLKSSTPWNKRLGVILRAVRQAEVYCRARRVVERSKGKVYDVYFTKNCVLCATFSGSAVSITTKGENATLPYNAVVAFRESIRQQGYTLVDKSVAAVMSCALCGKKLSGSVVGGVALCCTCFSNLSQTLGLIKKLSASTQKFK